MTKGEARIKLDIDAETFKQVLKSCNYTEEKVFDCVKISVLKKYMKLANIKTLTERMGEMGMIKVETENEKQDLEPEVVAETSNSFYISRKELIEVIAAAYDRGFKDSKNVLPVLTKSIINEMIDEVAVVKSEIIK